MARTLLSHEWLAPVGGSENVFEQIVRAHPGADLVCLWNDAPERFGADVRETWLGRSPLRRSKAAALPFMRSAWRGIDLAGYERVISSSHAFGHHLAGEAARTGRDAFCYVHSPARYIWVPEFDVRGQGRLAAIAARRLQRMDMRGTHERVHYAANSQFVRDRIRSTWHRDARVIYPSVDIELIQSEPSWEDRLVPSDGDTLDGLPSQFVLGASRLVAYKRLDLVMRVGEKLGVPVVIAGRGPDEDRLRHLATQCTVPVHFVGRVSDELLYSLYSAASLFVFLAVEDFGIMPVEAMALGTPVLVNAIGGARESVDQLKGGFAVDIEDSSALGECADAAMSLNMAQVPSRSRTLSSARFRSEVAAWSTTKH